MCTLVHLWSHRWHQWLVNASCFLQGRCGLNSVSSPLLVSICSWFFSMMVLLDTAIINCHWDFSEIRTFLPGSPFVAKAGRTFGPLQILLVSNYLVTLLSSAFNQCFISNIGMLQILASVFNFVCYINGHSFYDCAWCTLIDIIDY